MSTLKRVYLDVCALSRPFDDQSHARIRLETNAVNLILAHVRTRRIEMIVSPTHVVEIDAITEADERNQMTLLLAQFGTRSAFDMRLAQQRANALVAGKLGMADAAHLAFAEQAQADFVTVDDRLMKRYKRANPSIWCDTPLAYCAKEGLR